MATLTTFRFDSGSWGMLLGPTFVTPPIGGVWEAFTEKSSPEPR